MPPQQTSIAAAIPLELLSDIFHHLCDKPIELQWPKVDPEDFKSFPWAAGQVCRHWRRAFLSYPPLWASYRLSDHMFGNKGYPLNISFYGLPSMYTLPSKLMTSTWRMLLENSYRWQTADIRIDVATPANILHEYKGKMPLLTSLKIRMIIHHFDAFEIAPRLTHLSVWRWQGMSHLLIPWAQLTKLTLGFDSPRYLIQMGEVVALLHALQDIEELRFKIVDSFFGPFSYPLVWRAIRLTRLRLLEVPHVAILSWIEAPLLQHLHLTDYMTGSVCSWSSALFETIFSSFCNIRQLTVEHCQVMTVKGIMNALPNVEELYVMKELKQEDLYSVIRHCSDVVDGHVPLPVLRVLRITCGMEHVNEILVEAVSDLLKKRGAGSIQIPGPVPIQELTIKMKRSGDKFEISDKVLDAMDKWPSFARYSY